MRIVLLGIYPRICRAYKSMPYRIIFDTGTLKRFVSPQNTNGRNGSIPVVDRGRLRTHSQQVGGSLSRCARKSGPRPVGLGRSRGPKRCFGYILAHPSRRAIESLGRLHRPRAGNSPVKVSRLPAGARRWEISDGRTLPGVAGACCTHFPLFGPSQHGTKHAESTRSPIPGHR